MPDRHVLVTGATGFIASHLVRDLLAAGDRVRATVRSLDATESHRHLRELPGAPARLELVEADLIVPGSFAGTTDGITHVAHTASPYVLDVADPARDLVAPAVEGTRQVLEACASSPTVRRVVLTSSFAAIADQPDPDRTFTEADWNTSSSLRRNPYAFSKAEAERAAWAFMAAADRHFDLVALNPVVVLGPALGPGVSTSNQILVDVTAGKYPAVLALDFGIVDVRDVSAAHLAALARPDASCRYLCAAAVCSMTAILDAMRPALPSGVRLPTRRLDGRVGTALAKAAAQAQPAGVRSFLRTNLGRPLRLDASRARTGLGVAFRPAAETVRDTVADLVARGRIAPRG